MLVLVAVAEMLPVGFGWVPFSVVTGSLAMYWDASSAAVAALRVAHHMSVDACRTVGVAVEQIVLAVADGVVDVGTNGVVDMQYNVNDTVATLHGLIVLKISSCDGVRLVVVGVCVASANGVVNKHMKSVFNEQIDNRDAVAAVD